MIDLSDSCFEGVISRSIYSIDIQLSRYKHMSIDIQYVRHTCSTLNQVTSVFLVWLFLTGQSASKCNCWNKCEKNANILKFVPKLSIIALHKTKHLKFGYFLLLYNYVVKEDHVCRSTYSISIDIQYLDRHTWCVCQSRYVQYSSRVFSISLPSQWVIKLSGRIKIFYPSVIPPILVETLQWKHRYFSVELWAGLQRGD